MRYVFIVGCPHSGTSIVHRLLGEHPDVFSVPTESNIFLAPDDIRRQALSAWTINAVASKKKAIIEKTPWHLFHIEKIVAHIPDARFVCLMRDGRDVVASLLRRGPTQRIDGTIEGCKDLWMASCRELEFLEKKVNIHVMSLEDLCGRPVEHLRAALRFLDLSHDEPLLKYILSYSERPRPIYSNEYHKPLTETDGKDHVQLRNHQINSPLFSSTSRFADELDKYEIDFLTGEMQTFLRKYSYI